MDIFESLENLNVSEECFDDILSIVEEYINEVSVNMWTKKAKSSYPKRQEEVESKEKEYLKSLGFSTNNREEKNAAWDKMNKGIGYPINKELEELKKAVNRRDRASLVSRAVKTGSGSAQANKLIKAASKVADKRYKKSGYLDDLDKRTEHAATIMNSDPVKKRN